MSPGVSLDNLTNVHAVEQSLLDSGLGDMSAVKKAGFVARAAEALIASDNPKSAEARAFFVPGRIEVLGKHTDYVGGRSMVVAADRGFCFVIVPRDDEQVSIMELDADDRVNFSISPDLAPKVGHWSNYPMTVARRVARNFPGRIFGLSGVFRSDLPPAAGMSSSSALMIACFTALSACNDLTARAEYVENIHCVEDLAGYLGTVENGQSFGTLAGDKGVGTFGGSEDHTAIMCCKPRMLSQYSYCPTRFERHMELPAGLAFAVASSGVVAEKTGEAMGKYNRASLLAGAVVEAWRQASGRDEPNIAAALAAGPIEEMKEKIRAALSARVGDEFSPEDLLARFNHFVLESEEVIPAAGDALLRGDLDEFGKLVERSQDGAEKLLGNQVPQTCFLADSAVDCGAVAASAFGAGFGGSVWAMVRIEGSDQMLDRWSDAYKHAYPDDAKRAAFFLIEPGPAAFEINL